MPFWCSLTGLVLVLLLPAVLMNEPWAVAEFVVVVLLLAGCLLWTLLRTVSREFSAASRTSHLLEAVLATSREWLWTIGPDGRFTFSGPMSRELVGYDPSELVGKHFSQFIDADDLALAQQSREGLVGSDSSWTGLVTVCRHRDGTRVLVEVSGRPIFDGHGQACGFEGTTRAVGAPSAGDAAAEEARAGVEAMLASRTFLTAFQPIRALEGLLKV